MKPEVSPFTGAGSSKISIRNPASLPLRVLLYSHDSFGLGHLRRSLAIAGAIVTQFENANALVVTGSPVATQFELPSRCDVLKLPAVSKGPDGQYVPRSLSGCVSKTIELRSRLVHESYRSFDPHMVIVDHQVTGLHGEALPMLREAREDGKFLVYGLRDVLDDPEVVARAWQSHDSRWALSHAYDRICIYGTPDVFDPRVQYRMLKPAWHKIEFTGYIAPAADGYNRQPVPSLRKKVLVMVGGGGDGAQRIDAYLEALQAGPMDWDSHIVTGPLMEQGQVRHIKRKIYRMGLAERVRVSRFSPNLPRLLQQSDAVVSMAGYNSCAEIMQSGVPAVLMPRCHPRKEQLIRAQKLERLGIAQCIVDEDPALLHAAVITALEMGDTTASVPDLDGLSRICGLVQDLLTQVDGRLQPPDAGRLKIAAE